MRVWVYSEKQYEELGARRLEVEHAEVKPRALAKLEVDPDYEIDYDSDVFYRRFTFPLSERAKARRKAKALSKGKASAFGTATITEQVVDWYVEEDRIAEWCDVGQPEHVD